MIVKSKSIIRGLLSYVPGLYQLLSKRRTGGTDSAAYCYNLWFKHLTMVSQNGMRKLPDTIAELGPGDSIGLGLAALLSGVNNYYALDIVDYVNTERNLLIFDELVDLFKKRAGRQSKGWPDYDKYLDSNLFPSHILTEEVLDKALTQKRINAIRNVIINPNSNDNTVSIKYVAPWYEPHIITTESIDLIISHSVLEHVTDLENTYKAFSMWLKPKGMMSHQIDFKSHHLAKEWNGYWAYSELLWKIIVGKRLCMINRQPSSRHLALLEKNGFEILSMLKNRKPDGIKRSQLSLKWENISEDDLTCSGMFLQVTKK